MNPSENRRDLAEGRIQDALATALSHDHRLGPQSIRVEIRGLLATLSGTVETRDAARAAIDIAARMPRLRGIINRIQVIPAIV
jgi:osmotically-inducible protein OsmY